MRFIQDLIWNKRGCFKSSSAGKRSTLSRISHEHFTTRQRFLWTQNAHTTIPAITNSTNMLVCGEDLGLVPDFVPGEMQNLGILGLRIQRMPAPEQDNDSNNNREFGIPSRYPTIPCALLPVTTRQHFAPGSKKTKIDAKSTTRRFSVKTSRQHQTVHDGNYA